MLILGIKLYNYFYKINKFEGLAMYLKNIYIHRKALKFVNTIIISEVNSPIRGITAHPTPIDDDLRYYVV